MKWALFWGSVIGFLVWLDVTFNRRRDGSTLSEATRLVIRVHPRGRHVFAVGWWGFALWFWRHIIKGV